VRAEKDQASTNAAPSIATGSPDLEGQLVQIWARVLGCEKIGRNDNFFDLGGTSLQLTSAHAEIQKQLAPSITLVNLFEHPTINGLAAFIGRGMKTGSSINAARSRAARQGAVMSRMRKKKSGTR
jgi:aryl carrier-like protein